METLKIESSDEVFNYICDVAASGDGIPAVIWETSLDDSKDSLQQIAVVSAGFIGTRAQWTELRSRWFRQLSEDGIAYFRNADCVSVRGPFFHLRDIGPLAEAKKKALEIRSRLEHIIREVGVQGIGVAIAMPDYREIAAMQEYQHKFSGKASDPYDKALQSVMFETVKKVKTAHGHHMTVFFHDDGDDFSHLHDNVYKSFRAKNPRVAKLIGGFQPLDDKLHPPLQAADLMANIVLDLAIQWVNDRNSVTLKRLQDSITKVGVWDKDYLLAVITTDKRKRLKR